LGLCILIDTNMSFETTRSELAIWGPHRKFIPT